MKLKLKQRTRTVQIGVNLPEDAVRAIDKLAKEYRLSRSRVVRSMVEHVIAENSDEDS